MNFLLPAFVRCEVCGGTRGSTVKRRHRIPWPEYRAVLEMSGEEARGNSLWHLPCSGGPSGVVRYGVGLFPLGQTSSTLSGGEAQRVKLVS